MQYRIITVYASCVRAFVARFSRATRSSRRHQRDRFRDENFPRDLEPSASLLRQKSVTGTRVAPAAPVTRAGPELARSSPRPAACPLRPRATLLRCSFVVRSFARSLARSVARSLGRSRDSLPSPPQPPRAPRAAAPRGGPLPSPRGRCPPRTPSALPAPAASPVIPPCLLASLPVRPYVRPSAVWIYGCVRWIS